MSFRTLLAVVVTLAMTAPAAARDYVSLAGSSTVFPFATIVAPYSPMPCENESAQKRQTLVLVLMEMVIG